MQQCYQTFPLQTEELLSIDIVLQGFRSISMAASQIMAGCYDTVIAGGVEQITMLSGKQQYGWFC